MTVGPDRVGVDVKDERKEGGDGSGEEIKDVNDGKSAAGGAVQGETEEEEEVKPFDPVRYANWLEGNKDELGRYVLPLTQGECFGLVRVPPSSRKRN